MITDLSAALLKRSDTVIPCEIFGFSLFWLPFAISVSFQVLPFEFVGVMNMKSK